MPPPSWYQSTLRVTISGNGGQISMAIPELDLPKAFHAGNYNEASGRKATREYVPEFILPAVDKIGQSVSNS